MCDVSLIYNAEKKAQTSTRTSLLPLLLLERIKDSGKKFWNTLAKLLKRISAANKLALLSEN